MTTTCESRHRAYRAMAEALRADPTLPAPVRAVRFFDAAAIVSAPNGLGLLLTRAGGLGSRVYRGLSGEACIAPLEAIGARLFERNVALFRRVVDDWRALRSPLTGRGPSLTPLAFDRAMVVFEQRTVADALARRPLTVAEAASIERGLRLCAHPLAGRIARIDEDLAAAVRDSRREEPDGFASIAARIAVGRRLVDRLHAAR